MEGGRKPNKQPAAELAGLRERVRELEALQKGREAIESELSGARQRYQHLLAVSPAIIYTTHASGDFACTFVSDNIRTIMGFSPEEMITDPKCWPDRLHPEDAPRVFNELAPLIEQGEGSSNTGFSTGTGTTSGSRTVSGFSMTMQANRWNSSGPGPISRSSRRQSGTSL